MEPKQFTQYFKIAETNILEFMYLERDKPQRGLKDLFNINHWVSVALSCHLLREEQNVCLSETNLKRAAMRFRWSMTHKKLLYR